MDANKMRVPYALAVYGEEEISAVNAVLRSKNTGLGRHTKDFESGVAKVFGKKHGVMVNSGSSANLLALELLRIPKGSEVVTPILTFSTTLAPLIQKELKPSFVDVTEGTYTVNIDQVEDAITDKTKLLMIPSLIGNIPDYRRLRKIADDNGIFLIEDSCDTLGATIGGQPTGKHSHISTTSFYGSHIITAGGGGGMLCMNDDDWHVRCRMLASWGRSSAINESEDINVRYTKRIGDIPYDSKFLFEEVGYNMMPLEISAAFGCEQLKRLPEFTKIRHRNFETLMKFFRSYEDYFVLPRIADDVDTNMLAFPTTIRSDAPFSRFDIVKHLEEDNIQTRPVFTGNVLKQRGFKDVDYTSSVKSFDVTDAVMRSGFLIGCNQGLTQEHMDYMTNSLEAFLKRF